MINYYADVLPDGRIRACFKYENPDVGPPTPLWQYQAEGEVVLLDAPINWAEPWPGGVLYWRDGAQVWEDTRPLDVTIADTIAAIDAAADAARLVVSPAGRDLEYKRAEDQARAFKAAEYTGEVPRAVQSWATAKQWTAQQSADDIISTAEEWYDALDHIRDLRLNAKEKVRVGTANGEVDDILTQFQKDLAAVMAAIL